MYNNQQHFHKGSAIDEILLFKYQHNYEEFVTCICNVYVRYGIVVIQDNVSLTIININQVYNTIIINIS